MIFLKRFLKIAIWIFIGSCLWVMAAFFGSNYTVEIFVQETRRSSFEKLNLFGSIGKIFNTQQELLIEIIENENYTRYIQDSCLVRPYLTQMHPGPRNSVVLDCLHSSKFSTGQCWKFDLQTVHSKRGFSDGRAYILLE